jgi:hypothetical protein
MLPRRRSVPDNLAQHSSNRSVRVETVICNPSLQCWIVCGWIFDLIFGSPTSVDASLRGFARLYRKVCL